MTDVKITLQPLEIEFETESDVIDFIDELGRIINKYSTIPFPGDDIQYEIEGGATDGL